MGLTAFVDTDVLVRHLTGDPPPLAERATASLRRADELLLTDVVFAECVFVLESVYEAPAGLVADRMRAALTLPSIVVISTDLLLRSLELYERRGLDYADAYLVASAELSGVNSVLSFDRSLARRTVVDVRAP